MMMDDIRADLRIRHERIAEQNEQDIEECVDEVINSWDNVTLLEEISWWVLSNYGNPGDGPDS